MNNNNLTYDIPLESFKRHEERNINIDQFKIGQIWIHKITNAKIVICKIYKSRKLPLLVMPIHMTVKQSQFQLNLEQMIDDYVLDYEMEI